MKREEEAKKAELAKMQADNDELRSAVVDGLTTEGAGAAAAAAAAGAAGVPLRNGGGVKFNVGGEGRTGAAKDSLDLAVARTPFIVAGRGGDRKKKKKRGFS